MDCDEIVMDDDKGKRKRRESHDLIDRSKLLNKRARKQVSRSRERINRFEHRWVSITLGRVCEVCRQVQPDGEFDDTSACSGKSAS
jgi:hypothetical protein